MTVSGQKFVAIKSIASASDGSERKYVYKVSDNQLIQSTNAQSVANYMLSLKATHRKTVNVEYRGYPYFETGDVIDYNTGGDNTPSYFITKNNLKLAGGMSGTLESRER